MISNKQPLESIACTLNSFDELRSEERIRNSRTLAHGSCPHGEVGMILGGSEGDVIAVFSNGAHQVFMYDGEDKLIVDGALAFRLCFDSFQLLLALGRNGVLFRPSNI